MEVLDDDLLQIRDLLGQSVIRGVVLGHHPFLEPLVARDVVELIVLAASAKRVDLRVFLWVQLEHLPADRRGVLDATAQQAAHLHLLSHLRTEDVEGLAELVQQRWVVPDDRTRTPGDDGVTRVQVGEQDVLVAEDVVRADDINIVDQQALLVDIDPVELELLVPPLEEGGDLDLGGELRDERDFAHHRLRGLLDDLGFNLCWVCDGDRRGGFLGEHGSGS